MSYFSAFKQVLFVAARRSRSHEGPPTLRPAAGARCRVVVGCAGCFLAGDQGRLSRVPEPGVPAQICVPSSARIEYLSQKVSTLTSGHLAKGFGAGMERTGTQQLPTRDDRRSRNPGPVSGRPPMGRGPHAYRHSALAVSRQSGDQRFRPRHRVHPPAVAGRAEGRFSWVRKVTPHFGPLSCLSPSFCSEYFGDGHTACWPHNRSRDRLTAFGFATSLIRILFEKLQHQDRRCNFRVCSDSVSTPGRR